MVFGLGGGGVGAETHIDITVHTDAQRQQDLTYSPKRKGNTYN